MAVNPRLAEITTYSSVSKSRLKSIYSDFSRQKASNPASFNSNVEWWRKTLGAFVGQGLQGDASDSLVLRASSQLAESLRYEGVGKPLGLAAVITELRDTRALIPLSDFLNSPTSVYDTGSLAYKVASYVVGKPLWWALEQLSIVDSEHFESEMSLWKKVKGPHVILSNVEKTADAIVERLRQNATFSPADTLYSFDSFRREFAGHSLSETDLKVLIKFLNRDKKVIVSDKDIHQRLRSITGIDRGILELKLGVENMEKQVEDINGRISEKTQKISECLRANRKEVAMAHLKSRRMYEELLRKRLGSLDILQSTLIQVETSAQDVEIMKQYESSTATLRAILAHPSLQREKIDETMDAMAEASAEQREIDETIRAGIGAAQDEAIDEEELQAELAGLVAEVQHEQHAQEEIRALEERQNDRERALAFPSVPSGSLTDAEASGGAGTLSSPRSVPPTSAIDEKAIVPAHEGSR
ncbi:Snf7-domain-containing protein [Phellopilus nigrolimitatus]|nr:Snf7-domain-containing protein [Phellopilus nigrolimitatus]